MEDKCSAGLGGLKDRVRATPCRKSNFHEFIFCGNAKEQKHMWTKLAESHWINLRVPLGFCSPHHTGPKMLLYAIISLLCACMWCWLHTLFPSHCSLHAMCRRYQISWNWNNIQHFGIYWHESCVRCLMLWLMSVWTEWSEANWYYSFRLYLCVTVECKLDTP